MIPAIPIIFRRKLKEERPLPKNKNQTQSRNMHLFHVDKQNRGKGSKKECIQVC